MIEPYWLTLQECLALHDFLLSEYGGSSGLRDRGLLESALARPKQIYHYGNRRMEDLAAAYAAGIIKNHPFLDGNKRTGFMMAAGFLERNGIVFFAQEADAVVRTLALASSEMSENDYATWLEEFSRSQR
jgi:death on curing protein